MALLIKTMQEETARLASIIKPLIDGGDRAVAATYLKEEDLDRAKAEETDDVKLKQQLTNPNLTALSALSQDLHEDNRVRRDMQVVNAGHKRLLLSALKVAYNRMTELEYQTEQRQKKAAQA